MSNFHGLLNQRKLKLCTFWYHTPQTLAHVFIIQSPGTWGWQEAHQERYNSDTLKKNLYQVLKKLIQWTDKCFYDYTLDKNPTEYLLPTISQAPSPFRSVDHPKRVHVLSTSSVSVDSYMISRHCQTKLQEVLFLTTLKKVAVKD